MGTFSGTRPRAVKFSTIGASITGVVSSIDNVPQMNFDESNRPNGMRFDANGNVVLQTELTLALVDPQGEPTASVVLLRVGGSIFTDKGREVMSTTSGLATSIAEAVEKSGGDDLEVGDTLTVTYTGDEEPTTEGYNGAKVYAVEVTKG